MLINKAYIIILLFAALSTVKSFFWFCLRNLWHYKFINQLVQ